MAEAEAKQQITVRNNQILAGFNALDYDAAIKCYTKDAILLVDKTNPAVGHEAIVEAFKKSIPFVKDLVAKEFYYFELISENTAYSNGLIHSVDGEGKTKMIFKDSLLWKKVDGEWYLHRDMFNSCPLPESE